MQALLRPGPSLRDPLAVRRCAESLTALGTIERDPARRARAGNVISGRVHVVAGIPPIVVWTAWRPRSCTIAIRVLTSSNAINTSATGQAAALIWWA